MTSCRRPILFGILLTDLLISVSGARGVHAQALPADAPQTTTQGATFIAPAGWSIAVRGPATITAVASAGTSRCCASTSGSTP